MAGDDIRDHLAALGCAESKHSPGSLAAAQDLPASGTIKQKRSRTFDRRFWWLKDRKAMLQFRTVWDAGVCKPADCPTKHHSAQRRELARPACLRADDGKPPKSLRECEAILAAGKPIKKALPTVMSHKCLLAAAAARVLQWVWRRKDRPNH